MTKALVLELIYELVSFIKRLYEKHKRKKRDDEIEKIKEDSLGAWSELFGHADGRLPNTDDAASAERSLPTSDAEDATGRPSDTDSNA